MWDIRFQIDLIMNLKKYIKVVLNEKINELKIEINPKLIEGDYNVLNETLNRRRFAVATNDYGSKTFQYLPIRDCISNFIKLCMSVPGIKNFYKKKAY